MIRRTVAGHFLLISQVAHAHLAAELAALVGNDRFAAPLPRGPVQQAVELHDSGWVTYDNHPAVNGRGEPADVFEMPLETDLPLWAASTQIAIGADPYAGLLVSLHGLALSTHAVIRSPAQQFALIKFQHGQVELQEKLRRQLGMRTDLPLRHGLAELGRAADEDLLLFNFGLLEMADQLSLNLCFDQSRLPDIAGVSARPGLTPLTLTCDCPQRGLFSLTPWPFAKEVIELRIPARQIPSGTYRNGEDLSSAIASAQVQDLHAILRR